MTVGLRRDVGGWLVRWNDGMAGRAIASREWPNKTVAGFAAALAASRPQQTVIVDNGRDLPASELYENARRLAGALTSWGLRAGDVVSFQLPNWWEASVIDLAAAMTGIVTNPIVPINRDAEVKYMLNESATKVFFIPAEFRRFDYESMIERIRGSLRTDPHVVTVRGGAQASRRFDDVLVQSEPIATFTDVDPNAVKILMYTSGTTGRPKGVLHSHNTIHADGMKMKPAMGLADGDVTFCPSPVTHISGYLWGLNMPWAGDLPAVLMDVWNPDEAFDLLQRYRCAFSVGATPFLQGLVGVARQTNRTLPDLKCFMCGGASVPPTLIYEAAEWFPNCIPYRTFGATESPTMTAPPATRADLRLAAETDGRIHGAEVRIVDVATGEPVAPGEEGEILVREPSMALGYARVEDNEAAYDDNGFFRMGDLGHFVEGSHLVCTGRKKDLIIRAGENISAKEVEDVLYRSSSIEEVAVVSMPSERTGEAICAFVVTRPGCRVTLDELADLVRHAGLARQKTPEHLELVDQLPKTLSGKVRKDLLRDAARSLVRNRDEVVSREASDER